MRKMLTNMKYQSFGSAKRAIAKELIKTSKSKTEVNKIAVKLLKVTNKK